MVLPLGGAMVIDPMDLMCKHHLTPTRGGMDTVNRNLNGAKIPIRLCVVSLRQAPTSLLTDRGFVVSPHRLPDTLRLCDLCIHRLPLRIRYEGHPQANEDGQCMKR